MRKRGPQNKCRVILTKMCTCRNLRIGLTVPEMDITGLYRINGEVFILPLEGGGTFANKMNTVQVVGYSTIVPVTNSDGKQVGSTMNCK